MLRRLEPSVGIVEATTLRVIAIIEDSPLDEVDSAIAAANSTLYVANHQATNNILYNNKIF